jgi:hypothetical protein
MGSFVSWFGSHWHSLLESLGIIGSLLFTGIAVRRDLESRRASEQLTLAAQHRRLWGQLHRRRGLKHVLEPDRDLEREPVTREEQLFLELAFVHFHTGWLICREDGALTPVRVLALDAGHFFNLPAPSAVWATVSQSYQPEFAAFIAEAIELCRKHQSTMPSSARRS